MSNLHLHIAHLLTAFLSLLLEFHLSGTKPLQVIKPGPGISRTLACTDLQKEQTNNQKTNNTKNANPKTKQNETKCSQKYH